ncbi:MAG: PHP domain-containing protein [Cellulosilyticaceae bacterium]
MKKELELYDIYPKVVKSHTESMITIESIDYSTHFIEGKDYTVMVLPLFESVQNEIGQSYFQTTVTAVNNKLVINYLFGNEQEHYIRVLDDAGKISVQLSIYALDPDLYSRKPYKGDLHVHTCFSDGKESPEFVAATYRKKGFDFLAITDHHQYEPSLRAIDAYKDAPIALKIFPGEEVHGLDNHIHIVNFGSEYSVNKLFKENPEQYYEEVQAIASELTCPEGVNAFEYAACLWTYDHIRKGNGLAIFAHPHWLANVYHVRDAMSLYQFENRSFDAFELIGGQSSIENNMQLAFYHEARAKGLTHIPIVGSSDSHSVLSGKLFDEMKTIVLAPSNEKSDIITSIKDQYSVAVESYHGEHYKVHGEYRLVSYTLFLLEHYFPLHDELCIEEGRAMLDYVRQVESAKDFLALMEMRTATLLNKYFNA